MEYKESIISKNNNKFHILTFGCKINIYESESISYNLQNNGYIKSSDINNSNIVIINSCTVTIKADSKSRYAIRKVRRVNPDCILIICGCLVDTDIDQLKKIKDVNIFVHNTDKDKIVDILKNYDNQTLVYKSNIDGSFNFSTINMTGHSRAFLKIQDGCDNSCSYCKIPLARGPSRSKNIDQIFNEIDGLIKNGFNEIVLSGINLGSYNNNNIKFSNLLSILSNKYNQIRFRISSIELEYIDNDFLNVFKNDNICPHIHIPLQSGSDKILKLMNRKYSLNDYLNKINKIKNIKNNLFVSTDLIIGFPSEDETDFNSTYNFIKKINFSYIHIFGYSPRKNTIACNLKPFVPERIRDNWIKIIKEQADKMNLNFRQNNIGKILHVIIEKKVNGLYKAKSDNYIDLLIKTDKELISKNIYNVKFEKIVDSKNYAILV